MCQGSLGRIAEDAARRLKERGLAVGAGRGPRNRSANPLAGSLRKIPSRTAVFRKEPRLISPSRHMGRIRRLFPTSGNNREP